MAARRRSNSRRRSVWCRTRWWPSSCPKDGRRPRQAVSELWNSNSSRFKRMLAVSMRFSCATCGSEHDIDDISFGTDAPLQWGVLSDEERSRSGLSGEQCEIDSQEGRSFYIRACLEIPIRGTDRSFTWGVWCSLSEHSYNEIAEHW